MKSLSDASTGRYAVLTLSGSIYTLNLDERVFGRDSASPDHDLRCDGDDVHLMAVIHCEVGEPMTLVIDLKIPGIDYTTRTTTPVVLIQPLSTVGETPVDEN